MKYDNFKDAILNEDVEAVKDLCANGSGINERYDDNQTPLHLAAQMPETEMCRLLIDAGADIKAIDDKNFTPLVSACFRINLGAVQMLIDAGADVNVFTTSYDCFLNDFSCRDKIINNYSPLEHALCSHNGVGGYPEISEIANLLVNAGLDINALDSIGYSALMRSFTSPGNSWVIADELISLGADVNIQAPNGNTALLMACDELDFGHSTVARKLIAAGADVNAKDCRGITPLMKACRYGYDDPAIIYDLLRYGADVNAHDNDGQTPLHYVSFYIQDFGKETASKLISRGARMDAKDNEGFTPADSMNTDRAMIEQLESLCNGISTIAQEAQHRDTPLVEW